MMQAHKFYANELSKENLGLAHSYLALKLLAENNFIDAIYNFELAESLEILIAEFINNRGVALAKEKHLEAAILAFEKALTLQPTNKTIKANLTTARKESDTISEDHLQYATGHTPNFTKEINPQLLSATQTWNDLSF